MNKETFSGSSPERGGPAGASPYDSSAEGREGRTRSVAGPGLSLVRHILLLLLAFSCAACAARGPAPAPVPEPHETGTEDRAVLLWERYVARAQAADEMAGPFRISANISYSDPRTKGTRASALLWGNGRAESPYPLRLDLMGGIGVVAAKAREDEQSLVVYVPEESAVYIQRNGARSLASFGVPVPLSLADLTLLLSGRSGVLFLPRGAALPTEHSLTANGARYTVPDAGLPGVVELSATGAPVLWRELSDKGWSIAIEPGAVNPLLPKRLDITHPGGYSAKALVKDIERISSPYAAAQLDLPLPTGTEQKLVAEQPAAPAITP